MSRDTFDLVGRLVRWPRRGFPAYRGRVASVSAANHAGRPPVVLEDVSLALYRGCPYSMVGHTLHLQVPGSGSTMRVLAEGVGPYD